MKLFVLTLALLSCSTQAFKAPSTARSTTTARKAAISPRPTSTYTAPAKKELKVNRGELVLDPYYGIPNGILGAAPAILAMHSGKNGFRRRKMSPQGMTLDLTHTRFCCLFYCFVF